MHDRATPIRLRRWLRLADRALVDALAPPRCCACGSPNAELCAVCAARLEPFAPGPRCHRCGGRLAADGAPCPQDHRLLAGIRRRRAAWAYRGSGGAIVRRHKFEGCPVAFARMVRGMAAALADATERPQRSLLVPVPMHPAKRRARGRDHAARLCDALAAHAGAESAVGALRRLRPTLPQADPRVTSRAGNVAAAFAVAAPRRIVGREVVLVDDVTTSGATARECARVLRDAGAARVLLVVAAVG